MNGFCLRSIRAPLTPPPFRSSRLRYAIACIRSTMALIGILYRYTPPSSIFEVIPAEVADHKVMLFPHRPDTNKGIYEVVQVARRLVHELGWDDLRVLVPRWLDADSDSLNIAYYETLRWAINERAWTMSLSFTTGSAKPSFPNTTAWLM